MSDGEAAVLEVLRRQWDEDAPLLAALREHTGEGNGTILAWMTYRGVLSMHSTLHMGFGTLIQQGRPKRDLVVVP